MLRLHLHSSLILFLRQIWVRVSNLCFLYFFSFWEGLPAHLPAPIMTKFRIRSCSMAQKYSRQKFRISIQTVLSLKTVTSTKKRKTSLALRTKMRMWFFQDGTCYFKSTSSPFLTPQLQPTPTIILMSVCHSADICPIPPLLNTSFKGS